MTPHDDVPAQASTAQAPTAEPESAAGEAAPLDLVQRGLVDGLTVHDADGAYAYVSPSFEALSGHAGDDLMGNSPFDLGLFHPEDVHRVVEVQAEALDSGQPWRVMYRLQRADGVFVWVESAGRVVVDPVGDRFVVVTRVAEHLDSLVQGVEVERRLKRGYAELLARQERFMTTVSHRARTPLTAVVGITELLRHRHDVLPAEQREVLFERLNANTGALRELFEEVTEADRLNRSDAVLQRRVVDLHDLVRTVVADVTADEERVTNAVPAGLRAVVDGRQVRRLLTILLGNSFKHAGTGAAVAVRSSQRDGGVELVVEDDGPGVPPSLRDHVFEPFVHVEADSPDPGSGLGLYIVSELAALHGGRAWVDDRPGGGARFHVWLPRPRNGEVTDGHGTRPARTRGSAPGESSGAALTREAEPFVERLLESLRKKVDMDVVYLSIFDDTHQHVLATAGRDDVAGIRAGKRIPLEDTYCVRMVADDLERVVGDTRSHPQLADLPATGDGLACWMGVPVHLPDGQVFGTLCCASTRPQPELPQTTADEVTRFAEILGDQLADGGFVDGTAIDAMGRVTDVLTRDDALFPVFQPIVDLSTGRAVGVEALARFTGDERPVDVWFADAARAGLLVDMEVYTAGRALAHLDELPDDTYLTLNLSPSTLQSRELAALLEPHPLDRLVVEVTEHAAVDNYEPLRRALHPYRQQGLRVAIDDVGTGYAGLGHLVQLHPDIIKVDRSLVEVIDRDPARRAAVVGMARMAEHLGAALLAEGVERPASLCAARDIGFTHAQGYLLAHPAREVDFQAVAALAEQALAAGLDDEDSRRAGVVASDPRTDEE